METGFGRNLLAELLDSVGRGVLLMALGIGWFVFLWGLNLPALLAGIALGTLLLLLRRLYRQTTLVRRETALRCRIGGELLLEKMLLSEAKEAHFQAALLLEEKWPLRMQRITADGALCRQEKPSGGAETLLALAGRLSPATDAQLVALGQRKRRTPQRGSLLSIMTQREKAPRYWGYGLFMLVLYILTGSAWYAMPGTVCLTLSVVCRSGQAEEARL